MIWWWRDGTAAMCIVIEEVCDWRFFDVGWRMFFLIADCMIAVCRLQIGIYDCGIADF